MNNQGTASAGNSSIPREQSVVRDYDDTSESREIKHTLSKRGIAHLRNFVTPEDINKIRSELDKMFDNFEQLPKQLCPKTDNGRTGEIREIAHLASNYLIFRQSAVYKKCRDLASDIFGRQCTYGFDHAIYKSPGSAPVEWHQDQFYSKFDLDKQCLSYWIPLQPVTAVNGGMQYSATAAEKLLPHEVVAPDSYMYHVPSAHLCNHKTISPNMELGDLCIHTPLTLHRSHPNNSTSIRCAWIIQFNKYSKVRFVRWNNVKQHIARLRLYSG